MPTGYQGRWAMVTGASAGLGEAFSRILAARGANLVLVARREERLREAAADLEKLGIQTRVEAADLADRDAAAKLMERLRRENLEVDILVNNAGFGLPGGYAGTSWQDQDRFIRLMVTSYAELAHHVFPGMLQRGWGRIINVASLAGITPGADGHTLYGASKSFLINFSQSLAAEAHGTDVKISAACPGFTITEFHDVNGTRDQISALPSFMIMEADEVAEGALEAVERGNTVWVPGMWNKVVALVARALPFSMAEALVRSQSARYRRSGDPSSSPSSSGKTTVN